MLHAVCRQGMVEAVAPLISLGAGVDARTVAPRLACTEAEISFLPGTTPLMVASFFGHSDVAERLLSRGADPRAADAAGITALEHARAGSRLFADSRGSSYVELTARLVAALVVGRSGVRHAAVSGWRAGASMRGMEQDEARGGAFRSCSMPPPPAPPSSSLQPGLRGSLPSPPDRGPEEGFRGRPRDSSCGVS